MTRIQMRRGTAAAWTSANPTLASGEHGFETDTGKEKVGTGSTAWTTLAYTPVDRVQVREAPITPYQFGSTGPGGTVDNTAPLNAMFAAAAGATSPEIYLPPGVWDAGTYATRTTWPLVSGLNVRGAGRARSWLTIRGGGNVDAFTWSTLVVGVKFEDMSIDAAIDSGDIWNAGATGGITASIFRNMFIQTQADNGRIYYQNNAAPFIQVTVEDVEFQRTTAGSVVPFYIRSTGNAANCNLLKQVRVNGYNNANTPFFEFHSATDTGFLTDWTVMNIIGEQNRAGLFHVYGPSNWTFINCTDEDASSAYVADIFRFDKSPDPDGAITPVPPMDVTMIGCARRGSSLTAGDVYDVAFRSTISKGITLIACNPNTVVESSKIMVPQGAVVSQTRGFASHYSGAGTPESAVTAAVGSTYARTDGGAGTSFYVKQSGTGNTGWVGK